MEKTVLVAGATGLVGSKLTEQLIASADFDRIHLLVRKQVSWTGAKIIQHKINFDNLSNEGHTLFSGVDTIFCCLGTTMKQAGSKDAFYKVDYTYVFEIASLGKEAGVKIFVLNSAMGANESSMFYYNKVKGKIENDLKKLAFEKLVIVRPSLLLGNRKEFRLGEEIGKVFGIIFKPLFATLLKKYKPVKDTAVAAAMIKGANSDQKGLIIIESNEI